MKKLIVIAATVALAACGGDSDEVDQADASRGGAVVTDTASADQMAGTYEITMPDGSVTMQQVNADGSYVDTVDGQQTETGTWRQQGEQLCYDPEGPETEQCHTGSEPGADGRFTVETEAGTTTVRKVS
ncbi:MAG: hypothetical protein ACR2FJ_03585 [Qipengyuania sp.]